MSTLAGVNAAQSTRTSPARALHHWVGGADHEGCSDRFSDVTNPATGAISARLALASAADVDAAVTAAMTAFPRWRDASLARRAHIMFRFRELLNARAHEPAALITAEHGKVLTSRWLDPSHGGINLGFPQNV